MTTFRAIVIEHFRRPRNRGALDAPSGEAEGANPLCGDRIRVQVRCEHGHVADARFSADACALCIAAASMLTEGVRGLATADASRLDLGWLHDALQGAPPPARAKCVALPLDTLHRALAAAANA